MKHALKEVLIEVKPSHIIEGEAGLFAARDFKKGDVVLPESQERPEDFLSDKEYAVLSPALQTKVKAFMVRRDGGYILEEGTDFNELPVSYFLNHSCEGSLGFDADGDFIALRDIRGGEELSYDYGLVESGDFRLVCACKSPHCRGVVTGADHTDPEFLKRNAAFLYPDLR